MAGSQGAHPNEGLDRPALVHRCVGLGNSSEICLEVEHPPWVDAAGQNIVEERGDVDPAGAGPPRQPTLWKNTHNVKFQRSGTKAVHHPLVGDLTLDYEALELAGDAGQRILVDTAEPASPSAEGLDLLASWAATPVSTRALGVTDDTRR